MEKVNERGEKLYKRSFFLTSEQIDWLDREMVRQRRLDRDSTDEDRFISRSSVVRGMIDTALEHEVVA